MEKNEEIEEILKSLHGKSAEQRVLVIESQLNVKIAHTESSYPLHIIREIIKARTVEPCPICRAEINPGEPCLACDRKGYVLAVKAEEISLKKLKGGNLT